MAPILLLQVNISNEGPNMQKEHLPDIAQTIDDFLNGKLDNAQTDAMWVRLMQQPEYYAMLETQAAMKRIQVPEFRKQLEEGHDFNPDDNEPGKGMVRESKTLWVAALAAIFLLALFLSLFRTSVETELSPALSQIHTSHLISPDISRSSTDNMSELEQGLYRAYLLSVSGDLSSAISEYEQLAVVGDTGYNWIQYNLAILLFNSGEYQTSSEHFGRVDCGELGHTARRESCYWFKANSYVATGSLERARSAGNSALERPGYYRDDIIALLRKISYVLEKQD